MKKVSCNKYYSVSVPVSFYSNPEIYNYDLGVFVDQKDAIIAGRLFSQAIQLTSSAPRAIYRPVINTMLVPENQYVSAFMDISNFITSNRTVYNFVKYNEAYAKALIQKNGGYDPRYDQIEK